VPVSFLVDAGYAVFNYDKRGVDDSDGQFIEVGVDTAGWRLPELADDALAAAAFVRGLEEIDRASVGLMGGSQAGWVNPLAASRSEDLAFIVSVVGPTVTVGEEIHYSDLTGGGPRLPADISEEQRQNLAGELEAYDGPSGYDPRPAIETMTVPGLWILGGRDASIPTPQTQAILDEIAAEHPEVIDVVVHEDAGHDIGHSLYQDEVLDWLTLQLGKSSAD
jgi:dienelactone hydrolase